MWTPEVDVIKGGRLADCHEGGHCKSRRLLVISSVDTTICKLYRNNVFLTFVQQFDWDIDVLMMVNSLSGAAPYCGKSLRALMSKNLGQICERSRLNSH